MFIWKFWDWNWDIYKEIIYLDVKIGERIRNNFEFLKFSSFYNKYFIIFIKNEFY